MKNNRIISVSLTFLTFLGLGLYVQASLKPEKASSLLQSTRSDMGKGQFKANQSTMTIPLRNIPSRPRHKKDTIELGRVNWIRDYEQALQLAQKEQKPIFILFQEVPGCMNCQRFGKEVMSNPLIVDVIEHEFVPLCIFNNKKGKDAEVLALFNEPSWNNPVVRIVQPDGKELTSRMARFHPKEIVDGIGDALQNAKREIPAYFNLLAKATTAQYGEVEEAVFPMYCFWSGELKLGQVEGVVNTLPGFMNGREVVKVTYDRQATSYEDVLKEAKRLRAIEGAFVKGVKQQTSAEDVLGKSNIRGLGQFTLDGEPKYYMSHTVYKHIPMLATQRIEVNRALYQRRDPQRYLSPSQIDLYQKLQSKKVKLPDFSLSEDIVKDWERAEEKIYK